MEQVEFCLIYKFLLEVKILFYFILFYFYFLSIGSETLFNR